MRLNQYSKFSGSVVLYRVGHQAEIQSQIYYNHKDLIIFINDAIGGSLRKSDIEKIRIEAKIHTAKFIVNYIPELYMNKFEKDKYDMVIPGKFLESISIVLECWQAPGYAMKKAGSTEIDNYGVWYET